MITVHNDIRTAGKEDTARAMTEMLIIIVIAGKAESIVTINYTLAVNYLLITTQLFYCAIATPFFQIFGVCNLI